LDTAAFLVETCADFLEKGLLQTLASGEVRDITVEISILDGEKEIEKCITNG
jgi:hypothetical protein